MAEGEIELRWVRILRQVSFWVAGAAGAASAVCGAVGLAIPSGICGLMGAIAGMISAAAERKSAALELAKLRSETVALAVAL